MHCDTIKREVESWRATIEKNAIASIGDDNALLSNAPHPEAVKGGIHHRSVWGGNSPH